MIVSKYEDVRGSIHNGDILLCSGNYPTKSIKSYLNKQFN